MRATTTILCTIVAMTIWSVINNLRSCGFVVYLAYDICKMQTFGNMRDDLSMSTSLGNIPFIIILLVLTLEHWSNCQWIIRILRIVLFLESLTGHAPTVTGGASFWSASGSECQLPVLSHITRAVLCTLTCASSRTAWRLPFPCREVTEWKDIEREFYVGCTPMCDRSSPLK
jgi:hypothetical protein